MAGGASSTPNHFLNEAEYVPNSTPVIASCRVVLTKFSQSWSPRFTAQERELLDTYEAIANSPELALDMQFKPGDIQLLSNHTILHSRSAYRDDPDPRHRRHLLRLWLSLSA